MLKPVESDSAVFHFVRSIKEVEALVGSACRNEIVEAPAGIPDNWKSVFHMARIAPALVSCLKACASAIEDQVFEISSGVSHRNADELAELTALLESCENAIAIAEVGPRPTEMSLH